MRILHLFAYLLPFAASLALGQTAHAEPKLVADLNPGPADSDLRLIGALGASAVILDRTDLDDVKLRISDGTPGGTTTLSSSLPFFEVAGATVVNGRLYFGFEDSTSTESAGIWQTDGTPAGTTQAATTAHVGALTSLGDRVIAFTQTNGGDGYLKSIDGVTGEVASVKDFTSLPFTGFAKLGGLAWFVAGGYNPSSPAKLTRTDGTAAGTSVVKTFPADAKAEQMVATSTALLFFVRDSAKTELWASDGTEAGTKAIATFPDKNPNDNATDVNQTNLKVAANLAYFRNRTATGFELWRSDGTAAGTYAMGAILQDGAGVLGEANGRVLFESRDASKGKIQDWEPWSTDGSLAGTQLLVELRPGSEGSSPDDGLEASGELYFTAYGPDSNQWYRSDGTAAGTKPLFAGAPPGERFLGDGLVTSDRFFFVYITASGGEELWVDDLSNPSGNGMSGGSGGASGSGGSGGASSGGGGGTSGSGGGGASGDGGGASSGGAGSSGGAAGTAGQGAGIGGQAGVGGQGSAGAASKAGAGVTGSSGQSGATTGVTPEAPMADESSDGSGCRTAPRGGTDAGLLGLLGLLGLRLGRRRPGSR